MVKKNLTVTLGTNLRAEALEYIQINSCTSHWYFLCSSFFQGRTTEKPHSHYNHRVWASKLADPDSHSPWRDSLWGQATRTYPPSSQGSYIRATTYFQERKSQTQAW